MDGRLCRMAVESVQRNGVRCLRIEGEDGEARVQIETLVRSSEDSSL